MTRKERQKEHARKHYLANKEKMKIKARTWTNIQVIKNKQTIKEILLKNPCIDCGEKDLIVLEFDHQRDKKIDISTAVHRGWSTKKLLEEIDKCEVRCANCHRRKTYKERGLTKYN